MELFTVGSFGTLGGCVAVVYAITAVLFGKPGSRCDRRLVLLVAMVVSFAAAALTTGAEQRSLSEWVPWVVAFFNGFLISATAIGASTALADISKTGADKISGAGAGARFVKRVLLVRL